MRHFLTLVIFIIACTRIHAQVYPVQVNAQLLPPYTPYLSDYTAPGSQKLMVQLRVNDPTLSDYTCKLRLTLEGVNITIRTKPTFVAQPLQLQGGGIPQIFYGEDLAEYFNPNALDFSGITRSQYEKGSKLPEGVYRFTIEVLDYNRGTVVSNKGMSMAWIILNDPPLLNLPRKDTKLTLLDPTNIPFSWTPRHTGSPNAAFTTSYIFRLVELWPLNRNPYDAFLSQSVLYEVTTNNTQIVYGMAEPALLPGRKYAWQVQAVDEEGRDLFKNQGKSEVYIFQYGDALGVPDGLVLQSANASSLTVGWNRPLVGDDPLTYRLRYRLHGNRKSETWYEATTSDQWRSITQLQPATEYEVQVRAEQNIQFSEYGLTQVFNTGIEGSNEFVCKSDVALPPVPANTLPPQQLFINDIIHAGGFDVVVRSLTASAGGSYTGEGMAIVPWFRLAKVRVTFKNISLNDQRWLTAGEIKTVWNADSKFLKKIEKKDSLQNLKQTGDDVKLNLAETDTLIHITGAAIAAVTPNIDNDIVVTTTDGERIILPKGKSYAVTDDIGNGYVVDKAGHITKTTTKIAEAAADKGSRDYSNMLIRFVKGAGQLGFDERKFEPLASYYQQTEYGQYIPWKAVTKSKTDVIEAIVEDKTIDTKKIRFELDASPLNATKSLQGDNLLLNVLGKAEGTQEELLALYAVTDTTKDQILGKVNVVSYDQITRNLVIVPVKNGDKEPTKLPAGATEESLMRDLSNLYGQAVADWKVSIALPVTVLFDDKFNDGESGLLTNYTDDMKKVILANGALQDNTYYLFLVENAKSGTTLGYMPRSKQAGFIFVDNDKLQSITTLVNTIAHEIGHGAFNLQHTFKEFALTQGSTDNLMDYTNGVGDKLYKYQWDYVHDPQRVIGLFEGDEDAKSQVISKAPVELVNEDGKTVTFISPAGTLVVLSSFAKMLTFSYGFSDSEHDYIVPGTLLSFEVDGKRYGLYGTIKGGPFIGYSNDDKKYNPSDFFTEDVIANGKNTAILMLPCEEKISFTKFSVSGIALEQGEITTYKNVTDFPLKPFSSQNARLKEKIYLLSDKPDLFDFADHRQQLTQSVFDFLKGDCEQEHLLIKLKASEYYSLNPDLFSKFYSSVISATTGDLKKLKDLQTENKNIEFWSGYIDAYKTHLQQSQQTLSVKLSNLSLSISASDWEDLFQLMGAVDYEELTYEQRLLLLKIATKFSSIGNGDKWIRTLIVSTPEVQQKRLLDGLVVEKDASSEHILLTRMLSDFKGVDGQEFTELTTELVKWIFEYYPVSGNFNYDTALANNKFISFDPSFWVGDFVTQYFNEKGEVVLKTNSGGGHTLYVSPFEYIVIESYRDYTISGVQLVEGAKLRMPALYAYMVFNNLNTQRLYKTGRLAFDVAMLSIGVGELNAAIEVGNAFRLTRSLADIGMGLSDITFSQVLDQSLIQSDAGKSFLDTWGNIMMAYGVLRIGDEFFNAQMMRMERSVSDMAAEGKLTQAQLDEIANAKEALRKKLNISENVSLVSATDDLLANYPKIDGWLKGINDATSRTNVENIIKNWSDDILTSLNSKIDLFPGLKAEFVANGQLLHHFNSLETTWWSKYALGGLAKRTNSTLPANFKQMVGEIEVSSLGVKLKNVTTDINNNAAPYLGKLFDEAVETRMINAWKTNNFSDLPSSLSTQLQSLKSQGYELAVEAKLTINGKNSIPDYLLVKKTVTPQGVIYDYANVKYIDAKYLPDSPFSSNQLEIVNGIKNNGVANCSPFKNAILDVNDNVLIPKDQLIQIKTVEKLTIDDLMNLVIQ